MARTRGAKSKRRNSNSRSRQRSSQSSSTKARARGNGARANGQEDAIRLLKNDHREVERLFEQFQDTHSKERQQSLATQICTALRTHTAIEEEIFYPAFLAATQETDIHHEAEIEHEAAKRLIEEIEATGARDDHFEARISVLKEMIKHHVSEEERRGGMFAKARQADMALEALGVELGERKQALMAEAGEGPGGAMRGARRPPLPTSARRGTRDARARS